MGTCYVVFWYRLRGVAVAVTSFWPTEVECALLLGEGEGESGEDAEEYPKCCARNRSKRCDRSLCLGFELVGGLLVVRRRGRRGPVVEVDISV